MITYPDLDHLKISEFVVIELRDKKKLSKNSNWDKALENNAEWLEL